MKAQSGKTGKGGGAYGSKSSKASALSESRYKKAKASENLRTQIRNTGKKRGK